MARGSLAYVSFVSFSAWTVLFHMKSLINGYVLDFFLARYGDLRLYILNQVVRFCFIFLNMVKEAAYLFYKKKVELSWILEVLHSYDRL